MKGLRNNLLGFPAIQALHLLTQVNVVEDYGKNIHERFPKLFQGLSTLDEPYHIKLKANATPFALFTANNVPLPLLNKVKEHLANMEATGVISCVEVPTDLVVVPKKNGDLRICVDLKPLNEAVLRATHPLPKVDTTLALLSGAHVFSKYSGFWQIPLIEELRLLTTFITPFGRYCFNKLPFGISSAPEHFQCAMNKVIAGLEGVVCLMDDTLVFGRSKEEHDKRLLATLKRIQAAGLKLNKEKCIFSSKRLKFLGHIIDKDGISADPDKTAAIQDLQPPKDVSGLRRGMVTQLGKFSPNVAQLNQPLRSLLSNKQAWCWGPAQQESFSHLKTELLKPTVLTYYDPEADTKVSADASSYGLGAVLLQLTNSIWKPVSFASRSMSDTELRYAQIEKEALATTWACDKFKDYLIGKHFCIETDHKPLVPLLSSKHLDNLPPRILRFRLRLMRFHYTVTHVPGKLLYTADTLSHAPVARPGKDFLEEVDGFIGGITATVPASVNMLQRYCSAQI